MQSPVTTTQTNLTSTTNITNPVNKMAAPKTQTNNNNGNNVTETEAEAAAAAYMKHFENMLTEIVLTKEYKPQVANEFDRYLNPQSLKRFVLHSEKVRKIITEYAREKKCLPKQVEQQAKAILDEIGLDRSLTIIRWCGIVIMSMGKRILTGIHVNAASIAEVKHGLGKNPVLYLPSHRSYMDFILMSYICFHYEIEIPGIAAGMDFHAMFAMGTMLRKTGAFFMRRSFSNDEFYWEIFREYMHALITAYHIGVEFFIEGTRSRNFKALVPKVGLLSMALLPYFTGEVPDITVVPVSISYERVLEEQLFVYELLGVPKPKESTKGFFKALKIIDERFGSMYFDFGAPISVREFFGHTCVDRMQRSAVGAHLQKLNKSEIELVKRLANEVVYQQQRRIVISTFNLLSLHYASQLYAKNSVNIDELSRGICRLKRIFEQLGAHVAVDLNRLKPAIIETVEVHSNIVHFHNAQLQFTQVVVEQLAQQIDPKRLKAHSLSPQTMAIAVPTMSLQLYINPCLFWLARPAYLILAALSLQEEQQRQPATSPKTCDELLEYLIVRATALDNIFKHEFIIESHREAEEFKRNLKFLETNGILSINPHTVQIQMLENDCSRVVLSALAPFLCVYYQLALTVNQFPTETEFSSKEVLVRMQQRIEELLQQPPSPQTNHVHPYCLALDNLNIALHSFVQEGYLLKNRDKGTLQHAPSSGDKSLRQLEEQLLHYCRLMPFTQYYEPGPTTPVQWRMPAKL